MEIILRNTKLKFEYTQHIEFTELFKDVTDIGGGYSSPEGTASVTNNIVVTTKEHTSAKFPFVTGHKYIVSVATSALYMWILTSNLYNTNGVSIHYNSDGTPVIVTDNPDGTINFKTHPYLCLKFSNTLNKDVNIEIYIYDITGYEDERFANITYEDMKSGKIKIVDTNV